MKRKRNYFARALVGIVVALCLSPLCGLPALVGYSSLTGNRFIVASRHFEFSIVPTHRSSNARTIRWGQYVPILSPSSGGFHCDQLQAYGANLGVALVELQICNQW